MLGTFVIFFSSKNKDKIITSSLSFASGVMVCVSLLDLMPESLNMLNNNLNLFLSIILFLIFLCIGVLTSMAIDKYLPETKEINIVLNYRKYSFILLGDNSGYFL